LNEGYGQALVARKRLEQEVSSVFSTLNDKGVVGRQQTAESIREITTVTGTLEGSTILMALSQDRNGDTSLSQHALTTCTLSLLIGQNFNFNPLELRELATAAVLHDIGLLQVPPHVIQRFYSTSTPLASREMLQMQAHPRLGMLTLERQGGFEDQVLKIIEEHHALLEEAATPKKNAGPLRRIGPGLSCSRIATMNSSPDSAAPHRLPLTRRFNTSSGRLRKGNSIARFLLGSSNWSESILFTVASG